jgi:hypothetical protein
VFVITQGFVMYQPSARIKLRNVASSALISSASLTVSVAGVTVTVLVRLSGVGTQTAVELVDEVIGGATVFVVVAATVVVVAVVKVVVLTETEVVTTVVVLTEFAGSATNCAGE